MNFAGNLKSFIEVGNSVNLLAGAKQQSKNLQPV